MAVTKKYLLSALNSSLQREYYKCEINFNLESSTCIPLMSSNTTPSGVASASSESSQYTRAFRAMMGNPTQSWVTTSGIKTGWLRYDFPETVLIGGYSVTGETNSNPIGRPISWTLESSSEGTDWEVIHTVSNATYDSYNPIDDPYPMAYYTLPLPKYASKIRINVSAIDSPQLISSLYLRGFRVFRSSPTVDLVSLGTDEPSSDIFIENGFNDDVLKYVDSAGTYAILNSPELSLYVDDADYKPIPKVTTTGGGLQTENTTSIDLRKYAGINGVTVTGRDCRYLVSFDNGVTWYNRKRIIGYPGSETITAIPTMTSNIVPSGVASGSTSLGANYDPYKAFDKSINPWTGYAATTRATVASPTILQYKFTAPVVINKYGINLYLSNGAALPKDWTFQGSVNGTEWVVLDTRSVTGLSNGVQTFYQYTAPNSTAYLYYRLVVTDINHPTSTGGLQITELEMYRAIPIYGFGVCNKEDVETVGMTESDINTATTAMWADIFTPTKLDIMSYLPVQDIEYYDNYRIDNGQDATFSQDGMTVISTKTYPAYSNAFRSKGKYYFEVTANGTYANQAKQGLVSRDGKHSFYIFANTGGIYIDENYVTALTNATVGTLSFSVDLDKNVVTIRTSSGNQGSYSIPSGQEWAPALMSYSSATFNFGDQPLLRGASSLPSGYRLWATYRPNVEKILVSLPPNQAPVIQNVNLSPSTIHVGSATLTGLITDKEEDDVQYRISVNNQEDIVPWTQLTAGPQEINIVIPVESSPVGTNAITIEASDGDKSAIPTIIYLTRTNDNPTITGVLTGDCLSATVGDPEGDLIKYRILVNGKVRRDWTQFMEAPTVIEYRISTQDVILNAQNNVTIEAQDNMGGVGNCVFDFVGQYYNIMFMDEYGDYYSDDKGQMLKALDLGSFLIRQSSEVKPVIIKNTTGMLLKDIVISSDPNEDTVIELSLTKEGFDKRISITLPVILGNGDTYTIYIKARADQEQAIGKNALKLYATANHA